MMSSESPKPGDSRLTAMGVLTFEVSLDGARRLRNFSGFVASTEAATSTETETSYLSTVGAQLPFVFWIWSRIEMAFPPYKF